ncbi:hypothetical protein Hte_004964 [Hypoxylon texense]
MLPDTDSAQGPMDGVDEVSQETDDMVRDIEESVLQNLRESMLTTNDANQATQESSVESHSIKSEGGDAKDNNNNNNNNLKLTTATPPLGLPIASFPSTLSLPTQTKSQSLSSPLSTRSSSATPSALAQVNTLAESTIAGIVGGVIGALLLGVGGTLVFMRRSKLREMSRSSRPPPEKSIAADESQTRASTDAPHELDEQRDPSEMPSWDEQNPGGPNKPPAWEMQGSNKFTIWELPA